MVVRRFDPSRAVEIIDPRYGSGYRIGGRLVLTSAHLLPAEEGARCAVRWRDRDGTVRISGDSHVLWRAPCWVDGGLARDDAALIQLQADVEPCEPVWLGHLPQALTAGKVRFDLYGWPRWARTGPASSQKAGGRHIDGVIYLADVSPDKLLVVEPLRVGPIRAGGSGSEWEGISGAAIVCGGLVVAIQRHHQNPQRPGALEAVPIARFKDDARFVDLLISNGIPITFPEVNERAPRTSRAAPMPPEPFVPHPYVLLDGELIGRRAELGRLDKWVSDPESDAYGERIYCLLALGGIGKTAAAWRWFEDVAASLGGTQWSGKIWWSFYESGATFEQFVARTLIYVTGMDNVAVAAMRRGDRELALLRELATRPFLVVLDGLERALTAYADPQAFALAEDQEETAEVSGGPRTGERARYMADPNGNGFLRRLARPGASRVLVTSRLMPRALETRGSAPLEGVFVEQLSGLLPADALAMLTANGIVVGAEKMLALLATVDYHPLVTLVLASEVARFRPSPGDFTRWRADHPEFDPLSVKLLQRKSHILEVALRGLTPQEADTMSVIAAFSSPASYHSLAAILSERGTVADADELAGILDALENRGIVGWNRTTNHYDMHPIMRGAALQRLRRSRQGERDVYGSLRAHFESMPAADVVNTWPDLLPVVELFHSTARMGLYTEAFTVFWERLSQPLRRLGLVHQIADLLQVFVPDGATDTSRLDRGDHRAFVLNELAMARQQLGEPLDALEYFYEANRVSRGQRWDRNYIIGQCNLADAELACGQVAEADQNATAALMEARRSRRTDLEALALQMLGRALAISRRSWHSGGRAEQVASDAETCFRRAISLQATGRQQPIEMVAAYAFLAEYLQDIGDFTAAKGQIEQAAAFSRTAGDELTSIWLDRLINRQLLAIGEIPEAHRGLSDTFARAREIDHVEEETRISLLLLACLERHPRLGDDSQLIDELLYAAHRGPLPFVEADVVLYLSRRAMESGATGRALTLAREALTRAWPNPGTPFGYAAARAEAVNLLTKLGYAPATRLDEQFVVPWSVGIVLDPS